MKQKRQTTASRKRTALYKRYRVSLNEQEQAALQSIKDVWLKKMQFALSDSLVVSMAVLYLKLVLEKNGELPFHPEARLTARN